MSLFTDALKRDLKTMFLAAADRLHLTDPHCAAREVYRALKPVGDACEKYMNLETGGTGEFYGRLSEALLAQGWPADANQKNHFGQPVLDGRLAGLVWDLSIDLTDSSSTLQIRDTLEDRLNGTRQHTKQNTLFVLSHLDDVAQALASVVKQFDAELAQPGGVVLRHCRSEEMRSVFDSKNTP